MREGTVWGANGPINGKTRGLNRGNNTVRVWNSATGECELTLKGHSNTATSACFSPDGAKIVSASGDSTVRVWNAATGECELTLKEHSSYVCSARFSPDGAKIVSASYDNTCLLYTSPSPRDS